MFFTDRRGREWSLVLTIGGAERLRDELGVDIFSAEVDWKTDLDANTAKCIDVMFVLAESQCKKRRMKDRAFGKTIAGCFAAAHGALIGALVTFFPAASDHPEPNAESENAGPFGWRELYQAAGFLGIDPRTYTLRQLAWMCEGRTQFQSRMDWEPASLIAAMLHNANCKPGSAKKPNDFNPWRMKRDKSTVTRKARLPSALRKGAGQ